MDGGVIQAQLHVDIVKVHVDRETGNSGVFGVGITLDDIIGDIIVTNPK